MAAQVDEPDWRFQRLYLLAHLRGNLTQQAHDSAEELRRDGIDVNRENLRSALMFAIAHALPRSSLIPFDLADDVVEHMLEVVLRDYFREVSPC